MLSTSLLTISFSNKRVVKSYTSISASIGTATRTMQEHLLPAHLHHRHDGVLDPHVMSCGGSVRRYKALYLSSECHLPTNA